MPPKRDWSSKRVTIVSQLNAKIMGKSRYWGVRVEDEPIKVEYNPKRDRCCRNRGGGRGETGETGGHSFVFASSQLTIDRVLLSSGSTVNTPKRGSSKTFGRSSRSIHALRRGLVIQYLVVLHTSLWPRVKGRTGGGHTPCV